MSFQKFKTKSCCFGGKHRSGTRNIAGEITINKKTGREIDLLVGQCSICNRKKSMSVSDNTIQAEDLGEFSKKLGKKGLSISKKMAKKVLKTLHDPWILQQTLVQQQLLEILKMSCQHYPN